MKKFYALRILGVFLALFVVYLVVAFLVYAPLGHYGVLDGTLDQASFSDPWIDRANTILDGGLLYRDVYTTTPPLINFLLIPPVLLSGLFGHRNPWLTLSFMTYFSLFNLFAAYALLYMAEERKDGYRSALYFLLNPFTFGNSLLRRQDESILVFFFSLALLFLLHRRHWWASIAVGATLLIKLSGALLIPIAFLRTRDWRYLVIPVVIFFMILSPFLLTAGESAVFWNVSRERLQHPFQFKGISLGRLWVDAHGVPLMSLQVNSVVLIVGASIVMALIVLKPKGMLEDLALLTITGLILSPKSHCGYFSLVALMTAPLVHKYRISVPYFASALVILAADLYKANPLKDFNTAIVLMVAGFVLLAAMAVWIRWPRDAGEAESA